MVVDMLFGVLPIGCGGSVFVFFCCCAFLGVLSNFAIILKRKRERVGCFAFIILRMSCYCKCSVTLNHHTQGAEVTRQLRVNGKLWHLRRCTLDGWSLAVLILHLHVRQISFLTRKNTAEVCFGLGRK